MYLGSTLLRPEAEVLLLKQTSQANSATKVPDIGCVARRPQDRYRHERLKHQVTMALTLSHQPFPLPHHPIPLTPPAILELVSDPVFCAGPLSEKRKNASPNTKIAEMRNPSDPAGH
jgi:hypothetical protein